MNSLNNVFVYAYERIAYAAKHEKIGVGGGKSREPSRNGGQVRNHWVQVVRSKT